MRSLYRDKKCPEKLWIPTHPQVEILKAMLGGAVRSLPQWRVSLSTAVHLELDDL